MRLGLIARADNSGLGMQTLEFYKHMQPHKTLVVDISNLNGNPVYLDRYPDAQVVQGIPTSSDLVTFLQDLDVVFTAEAPYNHALYDLAKQMGVKVANQYNYEFFDWFMYPELPKPDMLIAPSMWNFDIVQSFCDANYIKHVYLHCPVNRQNIGRHIKSQARTFLHTAGRPAAFDRNGTETVIKASALLQTPAQIKIHFQGAQGLGHQATSTIDDYVRLAAAFGASRNNLHLSTNEYENYATVYKAGDVLIMPRRYGGNCLPVNEALAARMPVIMSDISPNNHFLPEKWLVRSEQIGSFTPRAEVLIYETDPRALAAKIDDMYMMSERDFSAHQGLADAIADTISWDELKTNYTEALESLCNH